MRINSKGDDKPHRPDALGSPLPKLPQHVGFEGCVSRRSQRRADERAIVGPSQKPSYMDRHVQAMCCEACFFCSG